MAGRPEPDPPRRGLVWRLVLGCLIVLLASGGATAVFVLEQVHTLTQDISVNKPLAVDSHVLAHSYFGGPETLLFVGDDWRPATRYYPNAVPHLANEMLLVRIDPSKPYISMMSIPRELWVPIYTPSGIVGPTRLNASYTGGTTYLLQTIKAVTGVSINHVIVATFGRFEQAIDELGCVYATIDERYYHNNADGGDQYQNVDLLPGYQCLDGNEAEEFVSYRHTDTSQIRDARDQAFLLDVKKQYGPELAGNVGKFEKIFGQTVQTDAGLRSPTEILNLANLLITAAGLRVRQVPFGASPLPNGDLTATPQQIQASVHNFLFGGVAPPTNQVASIAHNVARRGALTHLPLTATLPSNFDAEKAAAATLGFTAEFPKVQDLAGSGAFPVAPQCTQSVQACVRDYLIHAPNGQAYPIYVEVFSNGDLGQFYDVQGTTWVKAPLFADPDQTLQVGKRTYDLYYDGVNLRMVAWREYGAVYWVTNTLVNSVSNGELLAIAEQTAPIGKVQSSPKHVILKAFSVPKRILPAVQTPVMQTMGSVAGLLALVAFPLLVVMMVRRRRLVRSLRAQLHDILHLEASLGAAIPASITAPAGSVPRAAPEQPVQRHDYRLRQWRPAVVLPVLAILLAGAAGGGYLLTHPLGHVTPTRATGPIGLTPSVPPTVPVAVLNGSGQPGAAKHLAQRLASQRVHITGTGNVTESRAPGVWILYANGAKVQAERLAAMLRTRALTVAPIDSAAQAAAANALPLTPPTQPAAGATPQAPVVVVIE